MEQKNVCIWIWMQDSEIYKAVYRQKNCSLFVFNIQDELILCYHGLTTFQLNELEQLLFRLGAKQLGLCSEPFVFL
jgi:hypothetical protein